MKKTCISQNWYLHAPYYDGPVDLPHDFSVTAPRNPRCSGDNGYFIGGNGHYSKTLDIDATPRHYILDVDGAYMCTTIKCNDLRMVMHPHGYTPILVDLTPRIRFGESNKLNIDVKAMQPSTRWFAGAGIYRDVYLWEGGDIRIEPWDAFVYTPTTDSVKAVYEISADRDADVTLRATIMDGETVVMTREQAVHAVAGEKTKAEFTFDFPNAKLWDIGDPNLYTMRAVILENGEEMDTADTRFGVRTVTADMENGLRINGKTVKLRGGCIHHDHGVLGAADYRAACRRKLTLLQKAGFNALRIAHNPPSLNLLELCDEMGIVVMDEAFDCWQREKGGEFNYHFWFDDWWARDISYMVLRDRNHPCVFSYSTGNEIPDCEHLNGAELSRKLCAEIRKYDPTRLVTGASCCVVDDNPHNVAYFEPMDICGYNYMYWRYASDRVKYPNRILWGSETQVLNFYDSWKATLENSHVLGDFTWTAYDNLGEAGMGVSKWARDGEIRGIGIQPYPWRACYQGDFDLCGYRRPQSYFREAIWIGGIEPRIFTTHPEHYGEGFTGTGWHWYDVLDNWSFGDEYIGKPVKCEVYTDADEIVWFVNGREVGKSTPVKAIATMDIPYEKGEISVIAYKNGAECGRSSLHTVGAPAAVKVEAETPTVAADNRDLCYFDVTIVDENGDRIPDAKTELHCAVEGGTLMGIFSGDPANDDQYGSSVCHAFEGRAVAIIRTDKVGEVKVHVIANGLNAGYGTVMAE